jgi:hypothetical protein
MLAADDRQTLAVQLDLGRLRLAALQRAYHADLARHRAALDRLAEQLDGASQRTAAPAARTAIAQCRQQLAVGSRRQETP